MPGFIESVGLQNIGLVLVGIVGGGFASYIIARKYTHRPILSFNLHPAALLNRTDFGNKFRMSVDGNSLHNLCVLNLDIHLKGSADIQEGQVPDDNKPSLYFPRFTVHDVRTVDYDESRFRIPLGLAGNGSLVLLNIERLRAGTKARFQIIGSFWEPDAADYGVGAEFYPGTVHNVDVKTSGDIKRPWKKTKGERNA